MKLHFMAFALEFSAQIAPPFPLKLPNPLTKTMFLNVTTAFGFTQNKRAR